MASNSEVILHGDLRNKVGEVAMAVFQKKGIKNVTMDEIAHLLTMSKRTLYQLFKDKEELLIMGVELLRQKEENEFKAIASSTNNVLELLLCIFERRISFMSQVNPLFFQDVERYPKLQMLFKQEESEREMVAKTIFGKGVEQGVFRGDINWHIAYKSLTTLVDLLFKSYIYENVAPNDIYSSAILVYIRGLVTPKGNQQMEEFLANHKAFE